MIAIPTSAESFRADKKNPVLGYPFLARLELAAIAAALACIPFFSDGYFSYDSWWHIALGGQIRREWVIPPSDIFSHTARGADTHYHSWLSGVLFSVIADYAGLGVLQLLAALLVITTGVLTARSAAALGAGPVARLCAVAAFFTVARSFLNVRPQLLTVTLLALLFNRYTTGALRELVRTPAGLLAICSAFCLWSNLHGGFILGVTLLGALFMFETARTTVLRGAPFRQTPRSLAAATAAACAGTLVHPQGAGQYANIFAHDLLVQGINTHINEWVPPAIPLLVSIAILAIAALLCALRTRQIFEGCVVALSAIAGMSTWRHAPLFAVLGVPAAVAIFSRSLSRYTIRPLAVRARRVLAVLVLGGSLGLLLMTACTPTHRVLEAEGLRAKFPIGAALFIAAQNFPRRLYHPFEWGGYLLYALGPTYEVYVDGRLSIFGEVFPDEYFRLWYADSGWEEILNRRQIGTIVTKPASPLSASLAATGAWRREFGDGTAEIFVRSTAEKAVN